MSSMNSRSMMRSSAGRLSTKPSGEKEAVELAAEGWRLPRKPCDCEWRVVEGASWGRSVVESRVMLGKGWVEALWTEKAIDWRECDLSERMLAWSDEAWVMMDGS